MDHDAQLEDELRCRLKEGLQETEHGDVSALKHQPPVEVAAGPVAVPTALGAQVQGVDIPEGQRQRDWFRTVSCPFIIPTSQILLEDFLKKQNPHAVLCSCNFFILAFSSV